MGRRCKWKIDSGTRSVYNKLYIYLKDGNLTELFTVADSQASASAGTSISQLSDFQAENLDNGFYRISLKSATGISAHFLLHSTAESSVTGTDAGKKEAS